ncbi:MAG: amidase [Burkholderiales bacterium]|nr:amidase [Burkholderiales bacterium]
MDVLHELGATDAAARLARRELGAEALLRGCLARIEQREPLMRAFAFLDPALALAQARALDRGPIRGPLHGLPIGVKDIFDTHDMPTGYGSRAYEGHRPAADAAVVALARRAGALILGKTVTTEFASFPPGTTRNPHNPAHTPGGSSSGSAAGVADRMMPLALGTQTAGSVIRPAAFCGVVGYKPTYNLLARGGVMLASDTLDTIGVFARGTADAALLVAALARREDLRLLEWSGAAPCVGLCRTWEWDRTRPEMAAAFERVPAALSRAGARVREIALPERFAGMVAAQRTVMAYEGGANRADALMRHRERMDPRLAEHTEKGLLASSDEYRRALALAVECRGRLEEVFADCDVLLAPAATGEAPEGLSSAGDPVMNAMWTLLYTPCVTVNAGPGPGGLPVGLQVVGRIGDDRRALAAADWIQRRIDS